MDISEGVYWLMGGLCVILALLCLGLLVFDLMIILGEFERLMVKTDRKGGKRTINGKCS